MNTRAVGWLMRLGGVVSTSTKAFSTGLVPSEVSDMSSLKMSNTLPDRPVPARQPKVRVHQDKAHDRAVICNMAHNTCCRYTTCTCMY